HVPVRLRARRAPKDSRPRPLCRTAGRAAATIESRVLSMRHDRTSRCLPAVLAAVLATPAAPAVRPAAAAFVAALAPAVAAADVDEKRAAAFFEDAVKRYKAGEYEAAIIQVKNALQQNPKLLPAMALMGEIYVATGDGAAAETALKEAT